MCSASTVEPPTARAARQAEREPQGAMARRTRNRQAAVVYLQVAATTDDVVKRQSLRRRAAELILPL
jgi:hypothetical protein